MASRSTNRFLFRPLLEHPKSTVIGDNVIALMIAWSQANSLFQFILGLYSGKFLIWLPTIILVPPLNRPKFPDRMLSFTGMNQLSLKDRLHEAKIQAKITMTDVLADFYIDDLTDDLRRISFLRLNPIIAINEPFDSNYFRVIFEWVIVLSFVMTVIFMAGIRAVVSRFDHDNRPWFSSNPIK